MSVAAELANCQQHIRMLEARLGRIEAALAALQDQRPARSEGPPAAAGATAGLDGELPGPAGGEPLPAAAPSPSGTAVRQPLAVTPPSAVVSVPTAPTPAPAGVELSFADSFASLEERLKEQLDFETRAAVAGTAGYPVLIDAGLIDKAHAKPPPELVHVVSDLEEQYANLALQVLDIWGKPGCLAFLRNLIVDERGSRQGFPAGVMSELLILSAVAETLAFARDSQGDARAKKAAKAPS